jgi:hypothetical protein
LNSTLREEDRIMTIYTEEVKNILESVTSLCSEVSQHEHSPVGVGVPMRLPTRMAELDKIMDQMVRMTQTRKSNQILQKYKHANDIPTKRLIVAEMVEEFTKRLKRYGEGGTELSLSHAAFRYFRHKYNKDSGLDGSWLLHEAFSLTKLMNNVELSHKERYALFTALFQSGKTFIAIDLIIIYLAMGLTPIVVVPKSSDVNQLCGRIPKEITNFVTEMKAQGFSDESLSIYDEILYHSTSRPIDDITKFEKAITKERNRCIICLKHYTHIERLLDLDPDSTIALFIDEAHSVAGYKEYNENVDLLHDDTVRFDTAIVALKAEAAARGKVILQSATAAKILVSEHQLWSEGICQTIPGPWYRGPAQIEYQLIGTKDAEEEIINAFTQLSRQEPQERIVYRDGGRRDIHPIYLYIHAIRPVNQQKSILQAFHDDNPIVNQDIIDANWLVMTYQGEGLRVWHKRLMGQTLEIGGVISTDHGSGEHLLPGIQPYQMSDWCHANGGVEQFPRRAVLSFDLGGQGTTFSQHNFPHHHLTHALIFGNMSSALIAQLLNRLSGNHGDNHPLIGMVSRANKEKSIKEFLAHDRWIKDLCSLRQRGNFQVSKYLTEQKHMEGHLPKKYIDLKKSRNLLKTGPNPNLKEEKKAMLKTHAAEICIAYDAEKFEKDFKVMVLEKKELRKVIGGDMKKVKIGGGKYIVIEQTKYSPATRIYKMIGDIEKILIDNNRYNEDVLVSWVNIQLRHTYPLETDQKLHGAIWNIVQQSKKLMRVDTKIQNSLICWKENGRIYVSLTQE